MTDRNPHKAVSDLATRRMEVDGLRVVPVASAPKQSDGALATGVQVTTDRRREENTAVAVLSGAHGSAYVPPEGARVAYAPRSGTRNGGVIAGAVYDDSTTLPTLKPGERVVSHPLSDARIFFNADGTLDVERNSTRVQLDSDGTVRIDGDSDVVINGGSTKPVTNVSATTQKDSDGHVTSVSLDISRTSNVFVP